MKKKWISKGLVVFLALVVVALVGTACEAKPKTNAVWLKVPETAEGLVSYKVAFHKIGELDGEYRLAFDLPKEANLYITQQRYGGDVTEAPTGFLWVTPIEEEVLALNVSWWDGLTPLAHELGVVEIPEDEYQPLYLWTSGSLLENKSAALLYAEIEGEWWVFSFSFRQLAVGPGLLRAAICRGYTEEGLAAWEAEQIAK